MALTSTEWSYWGGFLVFSTAPAPTGTFGGSPVLASTAAVRNTFGGGSGSGIRLLVFKHRIEGSRFSTRITVTD